MSNPFLAIVAVGLALALTGCERTKRAEDGASARVLPGTLSCADKAATDTAAEPDYSADYLYRWQTSDGCDVRLDYVMTRSGACFDDVDEILMGWPLGRTRNHSDSRIYIRDPSQVSGVKSASDFDGDAVLPGEAADTGLRQDDGQLWMVPDDDTFIWLRSSENVERWPQERPVFGCA